MESHPYRPKNLFNLRLLAFTATLLAPGASQAVVTLVEPGHTLNQIVDSAAPFDPSQPMLDSACAFGNVGNIESIGGSPGGTLFVQVSSGGFTSADTCVFSVSPTGVVGLINPSTGFGINSRGTDLHFDPSSGLLVTQDQNTIPDAIATVNPVTGAVGTYSLVATPPIFGTGTFGMDFSFGVGGTDVPGGQIVFTSDLGASGIHSVSFGGGTSTNHVPSIALPGAADDMVIQPDGDWVWIGDFVAPITAFLPTPPHTGFPSGLNLASIFASENLPFVFGSRGTVCDDTGDLYVSYSGGLGGSGIFRVDEALTTATLMLTITGTEGLQDLTAAPSTSGNGSSVFFTVHDAELLSEEVWEVTIPECFSTAIPTLPIGGLVVFAMLLMGSLAPFLLRRNSPAE